LPDNDKNLAKLAGYGKGVSDFERIREGALHRFVKCSDGRFYHHVVAEKAAEGWNAKLKEEWKRACDRMRKANKERADRNEAPLPLPAQPHLLSNRPQSGGFPCWGYWDSIGKSATGSKENAGDSSGNDGDKPRKSRLKGREGTVKGRDSEGIENKTPTRSQPPVADPPAAAEPSASGARPPEQPNPEMQAAERRGLFAKALRDEGVTNVTPSVPTIVDWANHPNASVQLLREGVDLARDKKPKPEAIPLAYLKPIVEELLNPKPAGERSARHQAALGSLDWWANSSSVFAKAEAEGIPIATRDNGEGVMVRDHLVTLARLCAKLGEGPWFDRRNSTLVRIVDEIKARAGAEA
jgi:hypothetical protein